MDEQHGRQPIGVAQLGRRRAELVAERRHLAQQFSLLILQPTDLPLHLHLSPSMLFEVSSLTCERLLLRERQVTEALTQGPVLVAQSSAGLLFRLELSS